MVDRPLTLQTPRLRLTIPGAECAAEVVDYYTSNLSHLKRWEPPFPKAMFKREFWRKRLVQNQQEYRDRQSVRLIVQRREEPDGAMIGSVNFTQFVRGAFMACSLGYSLDEDAQGKGLMTEALEASLAHVFDELRMHRVMASYIPINERSGRTLKRLGFEVEGYARDYIYIDGAWQDHILTSKRSPHAIVPDYLPQTLQTGPRT